MQSECPFCRTMQDVPEELLGRESRCSCCGAQFIVRFHGQPPQRRNKSKSPFRKCLAALTILLLLGIAAAGIAVYFLDPELFRPETKEPPPAISGSQEAAPFPASLLAAVETDDLVSFQTEFRKAGFSPDRRDHEGLTLLMRAADAGAENIALLLLRQHASPELTDPEGKTALVRAAENGNPAMIETLIRGGADLNAGASSGKTALAAAIEREDTVLLETLIHFGAALWAGASQGNPPLIQAAARNFKPGIKILLNANADPATTDAKGENLLFYAIHAEDPELLETALRAGTPVNQTNTAGETPLIAALNAKLESFAFRLLAAGADPGRADDRFHLLIAAADFPQLLEKLLAQIPEKINTPGPDDAPPIVAAIRLGNVQSAALLLKNGAELKLTGNAANDPVTGAISSGSVEMFDWLQQHLELPQQRLDQALVEAARIGNAQMVQKLLQLNADPIAVSPSALDVATAAGFERCVAVLQKPTRDATEKRDREMIQTAIKQISPQTPGESLQLLEKAAEKLQNCELPEMQTFQIALGRYRTLAQEYDKENLQRVIDRSRHLDNDDAFHQLAIAIRRYPRAPQLEAAKNICNKFQTDTPEKKSEYEEFLKQLDSITAMNSENIAEEVTTFLNAWLNDLKLKINTDRYWASKSLMTNLPELESWTPPKPKDKNWNAFETTVQLQARVKPARGGSELRIYNIKLQRATDTLQWQILTVENAI